MPVVLRELGAARPWALPARGDVRVLGDPQRLETRLLDEGRELGHRDRVVGGKDGDAEFHALIVTGIGDSRRATRLYLR